MNCALATSAPSEKIIGRFPSTFSVGHVILTLYEPYYQDQAESAMVLSLKVKRGLVPTGPSRDVGPPLGTAPSQLKGSL